MTKLILIASFLVACSLQVGAWPPHGVGSGGTPPPFSPSDISGQLLWLKADAGVFSDAGTTPAVNNATVQQWNDFSGNSSNASQATGAARPTYKTAGINGLPMLEFDGSSDFMATADIFPTNAPYTLIVVGQTKASAVNNLVGCGTCSGQVRGLLFNSTTHPRMYQGVDQAIATNTISTNSPFAVQAEAANRTNVNLSNQPTFNLITNGKALSGIAPLTNSNTDASLQIGAAGGGSLLNGDISEIILYNSMLTVDQTNSVNAYLNARYSLGLPTATAKQIIFDGDSIVAGWSGNPSWAGLVADNETAFSINVGTASERLSEMVSTASTVVDRFYSGNVTKNIVTVWGGINDIVLGGASAATVYANFQTYCAARHAVGWKVVGIPILPYTSFDTVRNAYNALLAADTCADALVSPGCSVAMWADGANTGGNYAADHVHPNATGEALLAPCIQAAIDSL